MTIHSAEVAGTAVGTDISKKKALKKLSFSLPQLSHFLLLFPLSHQYTLPSTKEVSQCLFGRGKTQLHVTPWLPVRKLRELSSYTTLPRASARSRSFLVTWSLSFT